MKVSLNRYPIIGSVLSLRLTEFGSGIIHDVTKEAKKYGKAMGFFVGPVTR